jgi:hypothetical protein
MHTCPECGQACYCHGDIDDCEVETREYSAANCTCCLAMVFDDEDDDEGTGDLYDNDDEGDPE